MSWPFPPHTRGWTAGSDEARGFPRTRGDRPIAAPVSPAHAGMDPRPATGHPRDQIQVSPAHAGMDRAQFRMRSPPAHAGMDRKRAMSPLFPPHTRGWTVGSGGPRCWRFPRTRDRHGPGSSGRFPPHTRGWTWSRIPGLVSPAHRRPLRETFPPHTRGWTLEALEHGSDIECFPRTRGDGPLVRRESVWPTECYRFPRTRGDGPPRGTLGFPPHTRGSGARTRFPPHTRGWTFDAD